MLLCVHNLKVHFTHDGRTARAVNGIHFQIDENEVVGLVGESGSGKTVTALSIMRILPQAECHASGHIIFEGKDITGFSEKEMLDIRGSKVTMVFQEPFTSLNPVLRVGEQIDEVIAVHRKTEKKRIKDLSLHLLEKVKIRDPLRVYTSYPHLLSGGERQRVMIAMATSLGPKLLIADEPTTALDVTVQAEILDLILSLKKDLGMSVLFITHDFGIISKVADRIVVMKDGNIVEQGIRQEVLFSPRETYTQKLLEAAPKIHIAEKDRRKEDESIKKESVVLALKNLNKSFPVEEGVFKRERRRIVAVKDVSLEVKEGRTLGLVGESGSGKTTLGKICMELLSADSGEILGREKQNEMQIVFQDPYGSLDPRMRMQDIVLEGPVIRGVSKEKRQATLKDVLFKVHLSYKDASKYPHQFSGGQRQRIAIARALAVHPRILVLDEPVSSLDVIIQANILGLLERLQKELSLTYIFISHDLRVIQRMASDIAVMYKGEIVEFGLKSQIFTAPKHPYTKRLLSSVLN